MEKFLEFSHVSLHTGNSVQQNTWPCHLPRHRHSDLSLHSLPTCYWLTWLTLHALHSVELGHVTACCQSPGRDNDGWLKVQDLMTDEPIAFTLWPQIQCALRCHCFLPVSPATDNVPACLWHDDHHPALLWRFFVILAPYYKTLWLSYLLTYLRKIVLFRLFYRTPENVPINEIDY